LDKAEEAYKALADLDKDKPEGWAILADFYSAVNRQGEAIRIYQEILAKTPDFDQARYRLSEVLLATGDAKGAMAHVEELMKKDPDRQAPLLRARVRAQGGQSSDLKAAIEDLKEVLSRSPTHAAALAAQANFSLGLTDLACAFSGELSAPIRIICRRN
jgi:tetratricopeptide (TPR) repeat protein